MGSWATKVAKTVSIDPQSVRVACTLAEGILWIMRTTLTAMRKNPMLKSEHSWAFLCVRFGKQLQMCMSFRITYFCHRVLTASNIGNGSITSMVSVIRLPISVRSSRSVTPWLRRCYEMLTVSYEPYISLDAKQWLVVWSTM